MWLIAPSCTKLMLFRLTNLTIIPDIHVYATTLLQGLRWASRDIPERGEYIRLFVSAQCRNKQARRLSDFDACYKLVETKEDWVPSQHDVLNWEQYKKSHPDCKDLQNIWNDLVTLYRDLYKLRNSMELEDCVNSGVLSSHLDSFLRKEVPLKFWQMGGLLLYLGSRGDFIFLCVFIV